MPRLSPEEVALRKKRAGKKRGPNWGDKDIAEFIRWKAMADGERTANGLPTTLAAYSRLSTVPERTLRGWLEKEEIAQRVIQTRNMFDGQPETVADPDAVQYGRPKVEPLDGVLAKTLEKPVMASMDSRQTAVTSVEQVLPIALDRLAASVARGDARALETVFKLPAAQAWFAAQAAAFNRTFEDLSDEELFAQVLAVVPSEALQAELVARGL